MTDQSEMLALLPCPFCGVKPATIGGKIYCSNDSCFGPQTTAFDLDDSAIQWNTRAALTAPPSVAELEARLEWRDISTAPKDDLEIWAFNGEQARMQWLEGDGYALWFYSDPLLRDVDPDTTQPTHWMPLPTPPSDRTTP